MIGTIIMHKGKIQAKAAVKWNSFHVVKELMGLGAGGTATGKFWNLYSHLCCQTVFSTLKW